MIQRGIAGAAAAHQAEQRRALVAQLQGEAEWLEGVVADAQALTWMLSSLPDTFTTVHDVRPRGSSTIVDHVVVGPGGAFVVVSSRHPGAVDDVDDVTGAMAAASALAEQLATPVVAVVCRHEDLADTPPRAGSVPTKVVVCSAVAAASTITRGSHTLLLPHQIEGVLDRLRELTVESPPPSVPPTTPAVIPPLVDLSPTPTELVRTIVTHPRSVPVDTRPTRPVPTRSAPIGTMPTRMVSTDIVPTQSMPTDTAPRATVPPTRETAAIDPSRRRSRGVAVGVVVAACLVAGAAGAAARMLLDERNDDSVSSTTVPSGSTTATSSTTTEPADSTAAPLAAGLAAPPTLFEARCPVPGEGWNWWATWPGDLVGLDHYQVEFRNPDGTWALLAPLESAPVSAPSVSGQGSNVPVVLRITAVMTDGSTSPNQPTQFTSPLSQC